MRSLSVTLILAIVCGVIGGFAANHFSAHPSRVAVHTSARDRVLSSGTIRAAYLVRPPNIIKNPNGGKLSGIFVDILEEAGRRAGLRVEWVEEVTWSTMTEGLNTGRYDVVGTGIWRNATRGRAADFTLPLFYSGVGVFVRADDHRFDTRFAAINDPTVRISTIDGEMAEIIAKADYPNAQTVSLTQVSDTSQMLLEVQSQKADVTFLAAQIGARYMAQNPGVLRNIALDHPVRVFPESMMIATDQYELKALLDSAITEIVNSDFVAQTIRKYDAAPETYYLVALPYRPNR